MHRNKPGKTIREFYRGIDTTSDEGIAKQIALQDYFLAATQALHGYLPSATADEEALVIMRAMLRVIENSTSSKDAFKFSNSDAFEVFDAEGGTIEIIGNNKVITWKVLPEQSIARIAYSYSVPLEVPQLYPLGKLEVEQDDIPLFTEARRIWMVYQPNSSPSVH